MIVVLSWIAVAICAGSLAMTVANLRLYRRPEPGTTAASPDSAASTPSVSICIPARNEERNIAACVRSAIHGNDCPLEVLVYDDHSDDRTGEIVAELSRMDPRVRAVETAELPPGWNGKQFGCDRMGRAATGAWLLFTDADVRFEPGAIDTSVAEAERLGVDLISTFPRQITRSPGEWMLVPMIHFVLFSYLPMIRMRRTTDPAASAGCGQFLLCRREAWETIGGHAAWKASMHDGIRMPRAMRKAGFRTDLFDGSSLVRCRMYSGTSAAWRGFAKNAYEGLGSVPMLLLLTTLHVIGHLLPWLIAPAAVLGVVAPVAGIASAIAIVLALFQRAILAIRFRQSFLGVLLHPLTIVAMLGVQWHSFLLHLRGRREWRGRVADSDGRSAGDVGAAPNA